ncbi:DUF4407 domain-containing protein [Mycobacterium sp.]|uniref:DUF4407 domain-containing protein n=1 Tax=Mycobacterium sp. TaxID=1785 RepID=UPI003BAB00EA
MCAHEVPAQRSAVSRIEGLLTWFGGGDWRELGERHERSTHAVAGSVVLLGAVLAWLVASLVVNESAGWPFAASTALALVFGLLVGAVTRGMVGGPGRAWLGTAGRAAIGVALGAVVGELAAVVLFSTSINDKLDEEAVRNADSTPAVVAAVSALAQTRNARSALDNAVEQARGHLDAALVVARCEYNPTPACPQTRITGVPGRGPEARTANELLADAQRELDTALANRDRRAPSLEAKVAGDEEAIAQARRAVVADSRRGLGVRWVAMNDLTFASLSVLILRLLTIGFFVLLYLLPLILRRWRGETTHDRHAAARAKRERAELEADTAIAIKRAEVRRAAEIMWADQQLARTRLAIEAQTEIDREQQHRRVVEALHGPVRTSARGVVEPVRETVYLPAAAEADDVGRDVVQLPAGARDAQAGVLECQPVLEGAIERQESGEERGTPLIPSIPDATKAAARWIRPLMPSFVAQVIDHTTQPLRTARQVFEEVEEVAFSFKRTHKVTINSQSSDHVKQPQLESPAADTSADTNRTVSPRGEDDSGNCGHVSTNDACPSLDLAADLPNVSPGPSDHASHRQLVERDGPQELRLPDGPRELPPAQ